MIKIEFPADRTDIALAASKMLAEVANGPSALEALLDKGDERTGAENIALNALCAGENQKEKETPETCPYESAAIEAIILADDMATVTHEMSAAYGANLKEAYDMDGDALVSLETVAEVLADGGDPEYVMGDRYRIIEALTQTVPQNNVDVDEKGVAKDDKYCGTAAKPFYGSGKRKGQWKKRQGVADEDYDAWYASQLTGETVEEKKDTPINTSEAFGGAQTQEDDKPTTLNELMVWISERQAGGHLTEAQVTEAYAANGVQNIATLFSMPPPAQAAVVKGILIELGV